MTIDELITKFRITLVPPSSLRLEKKPTAAQMEELKAKKQQIVDELIRQEAEREAKRQAQIAAEKAEAEDIRAGRKPITVSWQDGSPLSGYTAHGQSQVILESLGIGRDIRGWGFRVPDEIVEQYGKQFSFAQAEEFIRPEQEAKAEKEATRQAELDAAFVEAQRTNAPVEIRRWSEQCDGSVSDCSLDIVIKYAKPDGSTKIERIHTF